MLYWFCHTSACIRHGCTHVPLPEPLSYFPPRTISLGHPHAPAPSMLYPASGIIHTEETRIERDTCTPMFIAALFIIARTWKQPKISFKIEKG